jgi:hypothetical protein
LRRYFGMKTTWYLHSHFGAGSLSCLRSRRMGHVPNGQYTERGIKQIHGFMSERWRIELECAIKVDASLGLLGVLLEPITVTAKALEQVVFIGRRSVWNHGPCW